MPSRHIFVNNCHSPEHNQIYLSYTFSNNIVLNTACAWILVLIYNMVTLTLSLLLQWKMYLDTDMFSNDTLFYRIQEFLHAHTCFTSNCQQLWIRSAQFVQKNTCFLGGWNNISPNIVDCFIILKSSEGECYVWFMRSLIYTFTGPVLYSIFVCCDLILQNISHIHNSLCF